MSEMAETKGYNDLTKNVQRDDSPPKAKMEEEEENWTTPSYDVGETCLVCASKLCLCTFCPLIGCCQIRTLNEFDRGVKLRVGKKIHPSTLKGGMHCLLPCGVDQLLSIDVREKLLDIPKQNVVTKEGLALRVDAVVYYKIFNASRALLEIQNVGKAIENLGQTKLREVLGMHTFQDIQEERALLAEALKKVLDEATDPWGVDVTRVEITDITLPAEMQRAMGQEAEATRNAKAKLIEADGEQKAATTLKNAADIMATAPGTMQLRFLQTLTQISAEKNSTIIIPFPSELLSSIGNGGGGPAQAMMGQAALTAMAGMADESSSLLGGHR